MHPRRLFVLAGIAAAFGVFMEATGGFFVRIHGIRLSAHGALRPLLLATLCAVAGFRLLEDEEQARVVDRGRRLFSRVSWAVPLVAAAMVLWLGLVKGTRSAGGSDVYGYVSQAALWRQGTLRIPQAFVASIPWPNADWTFTPLGYRPTDDHRLIPTYAPGLPLLMALCSTVLGNCGPYLVSPLCGAILIWLTYDLGRRLSGELVGVVAALCTASSPIVLFMALTPMSDVPVAMFWTLSLVLSCRRTAVSTVASGIAAGIALVIRPNLLPLALGPAAIAAWPRFTSHWMGIGRLLLYGAGCAPFALFVGWVFNDLYGSPLRSGYGDPGYAWSYFRDNMANYPRWLLDTQGPLVFAFLLSAVLPARSSPGGPPLRRLLLAFAGGVLGCYLWYLSFDSWMFLRFMLPALPVVFVLAADAVWAATRRFGPQVRVLATLSFCAVMVSLGVTRARDLGLLGIREGAQVYADVGRYVDSHLPENAIVLAQQHSGSIRYYSGRLTLRFDQLEPGWLDRALQHLEATGHEPYAVLETWEVPLFRQRFAGQSRVALLDHPAMASAASGHVLLYRATDFVPSDSRPAPIPATEGCK